MDDNVAFAENLAEILESRGALVDVVPNGPLALERVASVRYDALLTDMRMPIMGGAELVQQIRRIDPGLPALVITAYTYDADLNAALHEGLLAVLSKPVSLARLTQLLRAARRDGLAVLVDDDPAFVDNLTEVLRENGFSVVSAASVGATDQLGALSPFVALVDLRVPGGDDGVAMRRVALRFPGIPLVAVTARTDTNPPEICEAIFRKPFRTDDLIAVIENLHRARLA